MSREFTVTDLIDEWKPRKALADEVGANVGAIHKWARANRIPSEYQAAVVRAAQRKGLHHITGDWMVRAHEKQPVLPIKDGAA